MHQRCEDISSPNYLYYGGCGIKVCERWSGPDGYRNFVDDMNEAIAAAPFGPLFLGRVDVNGPYSPENCRWETWKELIAKRRTAIVAVSPNQNSLYGRALLAGLPPAQVYARVKKLGWTEERALSTPLASRGKAPGSHHKLTKFDKHLTSWETRRQAWQLEHPGECPSEDFE
jgi:hypothetical protein